MLKLVFSLKILVIGIVLLPSPGQAESEPASPTQVRQIHEIMEGARRQPQESFVSQGEWVEVEDRGFRIQSPWGWKVYRDYNGAMLHFQAPEEAGQRYPRNIRIMSFAGSRYIDDMTFQSFGQEIVENSSKMSNSISGYRLRNQMPIEISGDRTAGLYYAEFTINDVPLMQMHILVSSDRHHFLLTYTDLMEHFEARDTPHLNEAFAAMQSLQLAGAPPTRISYFYWLGLSLAGLVLAILLFKWVRSVQVKRLGSGIDEFDSDEIADHGNDTGDLEVDDDYLSDLAKNQRQRKASRSEKPPKQSKSKRWSRSSGDDDETSEAADSPIDGDFVSDVKPSKKKKMRIRVGRKGVDDLLDNEPVDDDPAEDEWKI